MGRGGGFGAFDAREAGYVSRGFLVAVGLVLAAFVGLAFSSARMPRSTLCSNETAAIATLRNVAATQEQFRARGLVDVDGDGVGEFGTILELTGTAPLRAAADSPTPRRALTPALLSPSLAGVTSEGWVEKAHYAFAVFLPRRGGGWIRETGTARAPETSRGGCAGSGNAAPGGGGVAASGDVDADLAETDWCAIAWPRMYGGQTLRVFLVTAQGDVLHSPNPRGLSCIGPMPCGPADFLPPDWRPGDRIDGEFVARDGAAWRRTN
jgi:hypothetical protein